MADKEVLIKVGAKDEASATLQGVFTKLKDNTIKIASGLGLMAIGKKAIESAMEFEDQMFNIGLKLQNKELTDEYAQNISDLAMNSSVPLSDLADGFFKITQEAIGANDRMAILTAGADLQEIGMGNLSESLDLITRYMKAYAIDTSQANEVANLFFQAFQEGNTTVSEMASGGMTDLIVSAKNVGVSGEEMIATFTALTTAGLDTSGAVGALNRIFLGVVKDGDVLKESLGRLGVDGFDVLVEKKGGLAGALQAIMTDLNNNGVSAMDAFKGMDTYNALMALASGEGGTMEKYKAVLAELTGGQNEFNKSLDDSNTRVSNSWDTIKNKFNVSLKDLGSALLPTASVALGILGAGIEAAADLVRAMGDRVTEMFTMMKQGLDIIIGYWTNLINTIKRAINAVKEYLGFGGGDAPKAGVATEMSAGANIGFRANGGGVSQNAPYIVGERGPEMFVPASSGRIAPSTNGITLNVNVSGNSVGDADELADVISNKIMQTLKFNTQVM